MVRRGNRFRVDRGASEPRRFPGRGVRLVALGAALCLASPMTALAAKPPSGVHVDPHSPVGKEYAIPLSQARGGGGGGGGGGKSGGGSLFGSGITKQPASKSGAGTGASTSGAGTGASTAGSGTSGSVGGSVGTSKTTSHSRAGHSRSHRRHRTRSASHATPTPLTSVSVTPSASATKHATAAAASRAIGSSHGSGLLWMALVALAVLVIGSAGGIAVKQRNRGERNRGVAPRTG